MKAITSWREKSDFQSGGFEFRSLMNESHHNERIQLTWQPFDWLVLTNR